MKYRKRKYTNKTHTFLPIIAIILTLIAFYTITKLFRKEVVKEGVEELVEEITEEKKKEIFIEELEVLEEKIPLENFGFELKKKNEKDIPFVEDYSLSNIYDRDAVESEFNSSSLEKPFKERELEKGELIKKAEKGLNEWRDDETLFDYLKEESLRELKKKEEERLGE